jgi:nucleoside-diphosphate-sugar epimerase
MIYGPGTSGWTPMGLLVGGVVKQKKAIIPNFGPEYNVDFLYIEDCARAIGMIHLAKEPKHRVYNVAYGKVYYLRQIAEILKKLVPDAQIELKGSHAPWPYFAVDVTRLSEEFAYQPAYDIESGIRKYMDALSLA